MTAGRIYTVAGNGPRGLSGDGGPATAAELQNPLDVQADAAGNLVVADSGIISFGGHPGSPAVVRVVAAASGTFYGQAMTAGDIYTVAGSTTLGAPAADRLPAVPGGAATKAAFGPALGDVRLDSSGNLLIADTSKNNVRVVPVTSGTFYGQAMKAGNVYTVASNGTSGFSGDGGPATSAELNDVSDVNVDPAGNLVIADAGNDRVRVVATTSGTFYGRAMTAGDIYTVAGTGTSGFSGDGGPATAAGLAFPGHVTDDGHGNLVITDGGNDRVRVVAAASGTFYGQAMTAGDGWASGRGAGSAAGCRRSGRRWSAAGRRRAPHWSGCSSAHQLAQRRQLSSLGVGGGELVGDLQLPAGRLADLLGGHARVHLRQRQLLGLRIWLEHAEIGDHGGRSARRGSRAARAPPGPSPCPTVVQKSSRSTNVRAAVGRDHDHLAAARRDLRCAAGPGQPRPGMVVVADHGRVEVRVAVDLRGAEERDVDPSRPDPVVEHLRHADHEVGRLGELAVADRERDVHRLGADRARLVDQHQLGVVDRAREDRGGARPSDADEHAAGVT